MHAVYDSLLSLILRSASRGALTIKNGLRMDAKQALEKMELSSVTVTILPTLLSLWYDIITCHALCT